MRAMLRLGCLILLFLANASGEVLTLKRAVQLALAHSPASAQAGADEQRAFAAYREARNQYIPQVTVGSGLGGSWGYPLSLEGSAPSLLNVTAQSALFNPALQDFMRAAKIEYGATKESVKDRHDQIVQDTTLAYLELAKWERELKRFSEQLEDAGNMEQIASERVKEGVDSEQSERQAKLVSARARLRMAQAQGSIDVLKATLSQLTGIPAGSIETDPDSAAALPAFQVNSDVADKAAETSPAVLSAEQHAVAQSFRARSERRSLWPSVDFATQYAVLAKYNNWLQFFPQAFERNNATVGVVIRFPFLNFSQRAHADAADADALRAKKEVQSARDQVSQHTLKLQRSVEQLAAAQEVSELEYELAKSNSEAIAIRMSSGTATVHDAADSRTQTFEKYNALEDANFDLLRARVGLMRATGELDSWIDKGK